jgi:type II secretory pathway pseudopilin PulG
MKKLRRSFQGYSMIEILTVLAFFSLIILAALSFFETTRRVFFRLQDAQETQESSASALEKIKSDVLQAGQGLAEAIRLGLVSGIDTTADGVTLKKAVAESALAEDAHAADTSLQFRDTSEFGPGKTACIIDSMKGELIKISSLSKNIATLASPLTHDYSKADSSVVALQTITFSFDAEKATIRRKVDAGTPQPLLEDVKSFSVSYDEASNIAGVEIFLPRKSRDHYVISVYPKNLALAKSR